MAGRAHVAAFAMYAPTGYGGCRYKRSVVPLRGTTLCHSLSAYSIDSWSAIPTNRASDDDQLTVMYVLNQARRVPQI